MDAIAGKMQESCNTILLTLLRYFNDNNWNSTTYPWTQFHFTYRCLFPKWNDWNYTYTAKGLWRKRSTRAMRLLAVAFAIFAILRAYQSDKGLGFFTEYIKSGLDKLANTLTLATQKI